MSVKSRWIRPVAAGLGVLLAAGTLAACGGDDSGELSKDEFIAQADEICADFSASADERDADFETAIDEGDFASAADQFEGIAAEIEKAIDQIDELEPPAEDRATIDEWLQLGRDQVAVAGDVADAIREEDVEAISAGVAEGERIETEADAIADEYGMSDCGSAGDTT